MNTTNARTLTIEGRPEMSVTFDTQAYAGAPVYLHRSDAGWFTGEVIGTLGSMVGHGQHAVLGQTDTYGQYVPSENRWDSFIQRMTRDEAAQEMVRRHLAR